MSALVPMDNNVDGSRHSTSFIFSSCSSLNDDEIMTLLNDTSFDIYKESEVGFHGKNTERESHIENPKRILTKARELNTPLQC
ncbi:hypothetical protein H5410_004264 [Solanum commersonii]|uniref:Uncharacterized protein n=1 Tax=Solanum commersonii TaxID=4109 RepID=A0A9J6B7H6_SOLCO|nr:hypothetical protein H5410_004264 [Solanum commersonii]